MMRRSRTLGVRRDHASGTKLNLRTYSLTFCVLAACAPAPGNARAAVSLLEAADSAVAWSADSAIIGDIDCDGLPDTALLGHGRADVRVGIVFGMTKPPSITTIEIAPSVQTALPTANVRLVVDDMDYDPTNVAEGGPGPLEGFRRSKSCVGLNLSDGDTDSMHMYWNHVAGRLDLWRR